MKKAWRQLHVEYNLYDNVCIVIEEMHTHIGWCRLWAVNRKESVCACAYVSFYIETLPWSFWSAQQQHSTR